MKQRFFILPTVFLLLWILTAPSMAASEYGVLYDETDLLWSEELDRLATEVLPNLTATYDIDLHVDILTDLNADADLASTATQIYANRGYGSPNGGNGVTLTLLVHPDEDGVALDSWHPYAAGESWELTTSATWNICRNADTWLTAEAWDGDLSRDIEVLTGAVNDMANGLEQFVLAGGVHSTIWDAVTHSLIVKNTQELSEPEEIPVPEPETDKVPISEPGESETPIPADPPASSPIETADEPEDSFFHPAILLPLLLLLIPLCRRMRK